MGQKVKRECSVCGREYEADATRLRHGRQTTCSRECSYRMRAESMSKAEAVLCSICGSAVKRSPAQRKSRHGAEYCSRTCHYKGRTAGLTGRVVLDGYNLSADARARLSAAGARRYAAGDALPIPITEVQVSEALHALGVEHVHQHVIDLCSRSVAVDLFFPDRLLVIELDERVLHRRLCAKDRVRDRELVSAGLTVRRVLDDRDAPAILARVLAVLA